VTRVHENTPPAIASWCQTGLISGVVFSIFFATAILTGCAWSVPEPVLVREPRPERIPVRIGAYYSAGFREFTYRHHLTDTTWILGRPSQKLFEEAFNFLFLEVVELAQPGTDPTHSDLAGIIEPQIVSAAYEWAQGRGYYPLHVTYGFTLYSPKGESLASWQVTGSGGTEPLRGSPLDIIRYVKRSFEHAMREAAWKFTSGFREVPQLQEWLIDRAVVMKGEQN
jgi:hypothetical protein